MTISRHPSQVSYRPLKPQTHSQVAGFDQPRLAAAPVGADMLNLTKADALVCVHKDTGFHAPTPYERVFLEKGQNSCHIASVESAFLTGACPFIFAAKEVDPRFAGRPFLLVSLQRRTAYGAGLNGYLHSESFYMLGCLKLAAPDKA